MGEVYRARDPRLQRDVAKSYPPTSPVTPSGWRDSAAKPNCSRH
jgi:hypothetical protein